MPIYSYHCQACGNERDQFNHIADRDKGPTCCDATMGKVITAPMIQVPGGTDISYQCQITGQSVQTMRQRQYIMDKNDMVDARDLKDTWKAKEATHKREQAETKAFNDAIPDNVRKAANAVLETRP